MFGFKRKQEQTDLEEQIAEVHRQMFTVTADSPEFAKMREQLSELYKIKDPESKEGTVLKDWIPVIGSAGCVIAVMLYEQFGHPATSKAFSFIRKV